MTQIAFKLNKETIIINLLEELNQYYPIGLYDWMYLNKKSEYQRLIEIENKIDNVLIYGTEEELKNTLREYWKLHKKNIKDFINSKEQLPYIEYQELNYEQIRKQRLEERSVT